jgi:hypothetical protein
VLSRKTIAAGAVLLILLVAMLMGRGRKASDPSRPDHASIPAELPPEKVRPAVPPPKPLGRYQAGARTPVPRFLPPPAVPGESPAPAPASAPAKLEARGSGELANKLEKTPPDFKEMQAKVKERMSALNAKADRCLAGWSAPDPALKEGVMLAIELDKAGLQAVSIKDMVDIPDGPLRCLSNAAYELDWSGITEDPVMLTVPQKYATR